MRTTLLALAFFWTPACAKQAPTAAPALGQTRVEASAFVVEPSPVEVLQPQDPLCPAADAFGEEPIVATVGCLPIPLSHWRRYRHIRERVFRDKASPDELFQLFVADKRVVLRAVEQGLYWNPEEHPELRKTLLQHHVYESVHQDEFSEATLRAYYDANPEWSGRPESRNAFVIALDARSSRRGAERLAGELHTTVTANPEAFKAIAREHSLRIGRRSPGTAVSGITPRYPRDLPERIVEQLFAMSTGEISPPIRAEGRIYIVRLLHIREAFVYSFEKQRPTILARLRSERYRALVRPYLQELREHGPPVTVDAAHITAGQRDARVLPARSGGAGFGSKLGPRPPEVIALDRHVYEPPPYEGPHTGPCPPDWMFAGRTSVGSVGCMPILQVDWRRYLIRKAGPGSRLVDAPDTEVFDAMLPDFLLAHQAITGGLYWTYRGQESLLRSVKERLQAKLPPLSRRRKEELEAAYRAYAGGLANAYALTVLEPELISAPLPEDYQPPPRVTSAEVMHATGF